MSAYLDTIDLSAAARTEYARRKAAWERMAGNAAHHVERARIISQANGDLLVWQEVVLVVERKGIPDNSRPLAKSARTTLERMRETGKATNDQRANLYALTRFLEIHVMYRHGTEQAAERKAAA
ncbi:MAG TPA: hypothetical protein VF503_20765 [Sphingobium sp.]|uniref:hypothetical protein n=1 Tax=Sphingobium sp. TaxID=1912891 RepID=UPI002ED076A8